MKSAAKPMKQTTKLSALATGLRLMTTAAPKMSMSAEKSQKKNGDISLSPYFFSFHFKTSP
jgi:hypothetical protein